HVIQWRSIAQYSQRRSDPPLLILGVYKKIRKRIMYKIHQTGAIRAILIITKGSASAQQLFYEQWAGICEQARKLIIIQGPRASEALYQTDRARQIPFQV